MVSGVLLRSVPVDLVPTENAVIITRGSMHLRIDGAEAGDIIAALLAATAGEGVSREAILADLDAAWQEPMAKLIDRLIERRVLVPADSGLAPDGHDESMLDVFYWNFGMPAAKAIGSMNARTLVVVGANFLSRRFMTSLLENGLTNVVLVDDPDLRNARLCDAAGTLAGWPEWLGEPRPLDGWLDGIEDGGISAVVCMSDFGHRTALRRWNETCVERRLAYFPVLLDRMHGEIGPLVIPGETACYECLRARENSNLTDVAQERSGEASAITTQLRNGFHGAMAGVAADIAVLEICKLLSGAQIPNVGLFSTLRFLEPAITSRYVLKVPRCRVCSPMLWRPAPNLDMKVFWEKVMAPRP